MNRLHSVPALALIITGVAGTTCAHAAARIGGAVHIERDVQGSLAGQSWYRKVKGHDVFENEFIRTAEESWADIRFVDKTLIQIASTATIKVDHVLFKSNRSIQELMLGVRDGAVRWISGESVRSAHHQVNTPAANIKVMGTVFDLFVEPQRTRVVLYSGTIEVCSNSTPRCQTLSGRGEIIATPGNLAGPGPGPGPSDFEAQCQIAGRQNCVIRANFDPPSQPVPDSRPRTPRERRAGPGPSRRADVRSAPPVASPIRRPYPPSDTIPIRVGYPRPVIQYGPFPLLPRRSTYTGLSWGKMFIGLGRRRVHAY
jgi:hypothetical protein